MQTAVFYLARINKPLRSFETLGGFSSKRYDMKKTSDAIVKLITYVLSVLLLLGAFGALAAFILREQGITFYVEYAGERYYSGVEVQSARLYNGTQEFEVSSLSSEKLIEYSVSVTSNPDQNFDFSVGGKIYQFYGQDSAQNDYSALFPVTRNETGFLISIPESAAILEIVSEKFGSDVSCDDVFTDSPYFLLTVLSGGNTIVIPIRLGVRITGVNTDTTEGIVFGMQGDL